MANLGFIGSVYDKIDSGNKGTITMEELIGAFKSFDDDGDGKVDKPTFISNFKTKFGATDEQAGRIFPKLDADGDGIAEVAELKGFFKDMDADNDNIVNKEEFVAFWGKVLSS